MFSLPHDLLYCRQLSGHSTAAGHRANCLSNCISHPDYFVFKHENVKVKVKYGFLLLTELYLTLLKCSNWKFCMILEHFSLGRGPFTRHWGRLEKFLPWNMHRHKTHLSCWWWSCSFIVIRLFINCQTNYLDFNYI